MKEEKKTHTSKHNEKAHSWRLYSFSSNPPFIDSILPRIVFMRLNVMHILMNQLFNYSIFCASFLSLIQQALRLYARVTAGKRGKNIAM